MIKNSITYNKNFPTVTSTKGLIVPKPSTELNLRLIPIEDILINFPNLIPLFAVCPYYYGYKRTLVDLKYGILKPNKCSCTIPGWHLDGKRERKGIYRKNIYSIFVIGPPTEFIRDQIVLPRGDQKEVAKYIPKDVPIYKLRQNCWNTYGEYDWHRGVYTEKEEERFYIRVTRSNYIKGNRL